MFTFCYFWPKMGKYFVLISFNMVFLANLAFNFHSGISITTTFSLQMYTSCKIWKKPHWNTSFFVLLTILDLVSPKFSPKYHTHFTFFGWSDFQWSMLGDNKSRSPAFWKFLFYQNICFEWVMNLFLSRVMFSVKSVISS